MNRQVRELVNPTFRPGPVQRARRALQRWHNGRRLAREFELAHAERGY